MWRTVGFLESFGVVIELCTLVSFVVIVAGGVQRRVQGWGVVVGVLLFGAFIQGAGMAIVVCFFLLGLDVKWWLIQFQAFLFDNDPRFWSGWQLDASFSLCNASWVLLVLTALGIAASAFYLPAEGDYELIPEMDIEPDDQYVLKLPDTKHPTDVQQASLTRKRLGQRLQRDRLSIHQRTS